MVTSLHPITVPPTTLIHRMEPTMVHTIPTPVHMDRNMPPMQPTIPTITLIIFHTTHTIMVTTMDMDFITAIIMD